MPALLCPRHPSIGINLANMHETYFNNEPKQSQASFSSGTTSYAPKPWMMDGSYRRYLAD